MRCTPGERVSLGATPDVVPGAFFHAKIPGRSDFAASPPRGHCRRRPELQIGPGSHRANCSSRPIYYGIVAGLERQNRRAGFSFSGVAK
jgi:hypothetical protein